MTTVTAPLGFSKSDWRMVLTIAEREVRDTLRDWRLVMPILLLTLFFPALMSFVASRMVVFLDAYSAALIGDRALPLLLMVVGFFPTSFSLVIALEAFVGEKERKSLEPLLATPLSNRQLYVGKLLASVLPPLLGSYIGITLYTIGVVTLVAPMAVQSVALVVVLTTAQAVLMVAASVVVSSQTTSVRAANMLSSFIIVPVALLLQLEAYLLAFEYYFALWWMMAAVLVTTFIFVRIGIQLFDREQLLGRNLDYLRFTWAVKLVWYRFSGRDRTDNGRWPGLRTWYGHTLGLMGTLKQPLRITAGLFFVGVALGLAAAGWFPLPESMLAEFGSTRIQEGLTTMQEQLNDMPVFIFTHNLRAIALMVILGSLTMGTASVLIFMLPWAIISFAAAQLATVGVNPWAFVGVTVVPHAIVELPALVIITAAALRWQAVLIAPPQHESLTESWLTAGADFFRLLVGVGVPLFALAAVVESFITPALITWMYVN